MAWVTPRSLPADNPLGHRAQVAANTNLSRNIRVKSNPTTQPKPPVTRSSRGLTLFHLVLAVFGWILFAYFWFRVFYRTPSEDSAVGVLAIAVLLVVCISFTAVWIRHNLILSRRHGNRRNRIREVRFDWSKDKLGRVVEEADWEHLQGEAEVEVDIDGKSTQKVYRTP